MAKRRRNQKNDNRNPKRSSRREHIAPEDMDDDVDTFHKQRDIIPLDINGDDVESSEEEEEPVLDYEDINDDEDEAEDEAEDEDGDGDDDDNDDFTAKIKRQQKYIREKYGGLDDEIHDDEDVNEEDKNVWGVRKHQLYGGSDYEGESSDSDALKQEEDAILEMQKKRADALSIEDFGLESIGNGELTMEEISAKGKRKRKDSLIKDLSALSTKEQMDAVYSSAPELVGLLSELNDALEQLETRVNPLLSKVKMGGVILEGGLRYLEVKQLLLLAYCQAITFYLFLKSEGQPVRDHPVIARLVEIKGLLEKMKQLGGNLPSEVEEFLKNNDGAETGDNKITENALPALPSESVRKDYSSALPSAEASAKDSAEPYSTSELVKTKRDHEIKEKNYKRKTDQVGVQSVEMLKVRAKLEEKLKENGLFSSSAPKFNKAQKYPKSVNGYGFVKLETYDNFNDDAIDVERGNRGLSNGHASLSGSSKLSHLISAKPKKLKAISGDDDLPKRDDIGERRRKHEMRVLAGAGVKSEDDPEPGALESDDPSDMEEDDDTGGLEDEFYEETKQKRNAKFAAKAEKYARKPTVTALPEITDGKRHISRQIEKNTGLTRQRRKDLKNPRKKYRTKHDKQKKRWEGQVQQIRKPVGSYGGETTGINAGISRSIRF